MGARFRKAVWCSDPELVDEPGYYAISADDDQIDPETRLVWIDEAPDDEDDGAGHWERA